MKRYLSNMSNLNPAARLAALLLSVFLLAQCACPVAYAAGLEAADVPNASSSGDGSSGSVAWLGSKSSIAYDGTYGQAGGDHVMMAVGTGVDDPVPGDADIAGIALEGVDAVRTQVLWDDEGHEGMRPGSITVRLLRDGQASGDDIILSPDGDWSHAWSDLPPGHTYTISRIGTTPDGYVSRIAKLSDDPDGTQVYEITNTWTGDLTTTDVHVACTWDDEGHESERPDKISVQLFRNGSRDNDYGTVTLDAGNNWSHTWAGLDGDYSWTVVGASATPVPGYVTRSSSILSMSGGHEDMTWTFMNTWTGDELGVSDVSIEIKWSDEGHESERPDHLSVYLMRDDRQSELSVQLSEENDWSYTWRGLSDEHIWTVAPSVDWNLFPYAGRISAVTESVIGSNDLTAYSFDFRYNPPDVINVTGQVEWSGGTPPSSMTLYLTCDGVSSNWKGVSAATGWSCTWTNLPAGHTYAVYQYSSYLKNYSQEMTCAPDVSMGSLTYSFRNTYSVVPLKERNLFAEVIWDDNDDAAGKRPDSVSLEFGNSYAGSSMQLYHGLPVSVDDDWVVWYELDPDNVLSYCIVDPLPAGYICSLITESAEKIDVGDEIVDGDFWRITLKYVGSAASSEKQTHSVRMEWIGGTEADRANLSMRVYLWKDMRKFPNVRYSDSFVLSRSNSWSRTWTDTIGSFTWLILPASHSLTGYSLDSYTDPDGTFVIRCVRDDTMSLTADLSWVNDNPDVRPDSVRLQLLRNGLKYGSVVSVSESDDWSYTWDWLGLDYTWSVMVVADDLPKGYSVDTSIAAGDAIDNKIPATCNLACSYAEPETVDVRAVAAWSGEERPESFRVTLYRNGSSYATVDLAAYDWSYGWTGLDGKYTWTLRPASNLWEKFTPRVNVSSVMSSACHEAVTWTFDFSHSEFSRTVDVSVECVWDGVPEGSIPYGLSVDLLRNGSVYDTAYLTSGSDWAYTWLGLDGRYGWSVHPSEDSSATRDSGFISRTETTSSSTDDPARDLIQCVVTNQYIGVDPGVVVTLNCHWPEDDSDSGYRPDEVEFVLARNGYQYGSKSALSASDGWSRTYSNLRSKSTWSVELVGFPPRGYDRSIETYVESIELSDGTVTEYVVYDVYYDFVGEVPAVDFDVNCIWDGGFGYNVPESFSVELLCDGLSYPYSGGTIWFNPGNEWSNGWEGLDGRYEWTVRCSRSFDGYDRSINARSEPGDDPATTHVTWDLIHTWTWGDPVSTEIAIVHDWVNKQDNQVFDSVTAELLCDGEVFAGDIILDGDNNWEYRTVGESNHVWTGNRVSELPDGYNPDSSGTKTRSYAIRSDDGTVRAYVLCTIASVEKNVAPGKNETFVAARKVWFGDPVDPDAGYPADVTFYAMRGGNSSSDDTADEISMSLGPWNGWRYIWYGLYVTYGYYYVEEDVPDGYFSEKISNGPVTVMANIVDPDAVAGSVAGGGVMDFMFPATGGLGASNLIIIGIVLFAASAFAYMGRRRK